MSGDVRRLAGPAAGVVAVVVLALMPTLQRTFGFAVFNLIFLYFLFFWITQATSWNIFSGYSGYFSFGQGAFYGAGLYVTANLSVRYGGTLLGALPIAALVGAGIAAAMGVLVFRLRRLSGEIFALFSLAVALALGSLANNWSFIDGGRGLPIGTVDYPDWLGSTTEMLYYLGLVLAVVSVGIAIAIQRSRVGFGLFAIRDDEAVAEAIGVPTFRFKLGIFVLNGVIAAVSGAIHAVQVNFVSPASAFSITVPLFVILMAVVGGRRHWSGPILGAVVIYTLSDELTGMGFAEAGRILIAVLLIVATLFLREGIAIRLLARPVPTVIAFLVTMAGQLVVTDATVITAFSISLVVGLVVLIGADVVRPRRGASPGDDPPDDASPSDDASARRDTQAAAS